MFKNYVCIILLFQFGNVWSQYDKAYIESIVGYENIVYEEYLEYWNKQKNKCYYSIDKKDEFSGSRIIFTEIHEQFYSWANRGKLTISFNFDGIAWYIGISSNRKLGCASPFKNQKSFAKIKLENETIIKFSHSGSLDCSDFSLSAKISKSNIKQLKQSPIKAILLSGTDGTTTFDNIEWKNFFIDKLKCLDVN